MGFYGNIANAAKANFQFDKIYPNRYEMVIHAADDDVFIGRYVLVEYDIEISNKQYDKNWYLRIIPTENPEVDEQRLYSAYEDEDMDHYSDSFLDETLITHVHDICEENEVIYFAPEHIITHVNTQLQYAKVFKTGDFQFSSESEFANHFEGFEGSVIDDLIDYIQEQYNSRNEEDEEEEDIDDGEGEEEEEEPWIDLALVPPIAHIANNQIFLDDDTLFDGVDEDYIYVIIPPGYNYLYNTEGSFWTISNVDQEFPSLIEQGNEHSEYYQINFAIDRANFHTERGYDSTIWTKTYVNGTSKYIKIADLNTTLPTIGIEGDVPTLIPAKPHWGFDSTNAHYQLHVQNPWGIRVKAASNSLTLPALSPKGILLGNDTQYHMDQGVYGRMMARDINQDPLYYPSDVKVQWKHVFKDNTKTETGNKTIMYFNEKSQSWEEDSANYVSSAIYFNKAGFNPKYIAYSEDIINPENDTTERRFRYNSAVARSEWENDDCIDLTPSGLSGHLYKKHDGTYYMTPGSDTQELSIMLPSIGDTISKVWDIVYGGREFDFIRQTNQRAIDIEWEDAKYDIRRSGLRLRGIYGNSYDTRAVNTLAGCINTTHDLLGMIIVSQTPQEMATHLEDYSMDRIYYNSGTQEYYRKHKTYTYTPVSTSSPGPYYEPVIDGVDITEVVDFPFGQYKYYRDYIGGNARAAQETGKDPVLMSDYIVDPVYHRDRDYYKVTYTPISLSPEYQRDIYWYAAGNNLLLDRSDEQTENRVYYTFDQTKLINLRDIVIDPENPNRRIKVYVPGKYYYRDNEGNYKVDTSPYGTFNDEEIEWQYYYNVIIQEEFNQEEGDDNIIYQTVITYERVYLTAETYESGTYYIEKNNIDPNTDTVYYWDEAANNYKVLATGDFDANARYYLRKITYIKLPPGQMVNVEPDMGSESPRADFFIYNTRTFFQKRIDSETGMAVEYIMLMKEDFLIDNTLDSQDIYVFGRKPDSDQMANPWRPITDSLNQSYTEILQLQDEFYMASRYHQILPDTSLILDTYPTMTIGAQYCVIVNAEKYDLSHKIVYEPNVYYIEDDTSDDGYSLSTSPTKPNATLYRKRQLYVYSDSLNIMPRGMMWNVDATIVPNTITLAKRDDAWEMIPLTGYATSTNTINGMILTMNQMLEPNDNLTREDDSLSGVLNQVKDFIRRFGCMKSNKILVIDSYGRIRTAEVTANSTIEVTINGDPENPQIQLTQKSLDYRENLNSGTENPQTLQWLYSKVAELERRVAALGG